MNAVEQLIADFSGAALCPTSLNYSAPFEDRRWSELLGMLARKNGFYGFEAALLVRPIECDGKVVGVVEWNRMGGWKSFYPHLQLEGLICFAANIFGDQFFFDVAGFGRMDAETGEIERLGNELNDWAKAILNDPGYHLGAVIAHEWQSKNGALKPGMRLVPKLPFVLGGEFEIENFYALNELRSMEIRGGIATQLHDVPDGSTVVLNLNEPTS